jgi:arylsulfatase A-like enzyme
MEKGNRRAHANAKPGQTESKQTMRRHPVMALLCMAGFVFSEEPGRKPNIVFILADDMGYADAGFNGGREIQTPHLDKLAKSGAVLRSHYVQPVCSPTRASLMTGRHVAHTGVYTVVRPGSEWGLPLAERTLPQALREAGYATAICGKWHLGEFHPDYRPTRRGFDHQYGLWFGGIDYFTHMRDGVLDWHRDDQPCKDEGYATHLLASEACRLIRMRDTAKPLFLYLPFNAVHAPHQVPDRYTVPYGNLRGARRNYAGMLAAMDEAVGKVVAALEEQQMTDDTVIVFSSDNGGPGSGTITDNGPLRAGKGTLFEGGVRVCAFATWPGHIPPDTTINEPMHICDWFPTLVKLAGGSLDQKLPLDGKDLRPALTQGAKSPHQALLIPGTLFGKAAVRVGDWKLISGQSAGPQGKRGNNAPGGDGPLLFNLATDIGERNNLANEHPEKLAELKDTLQRLLKDAVPSGQPEANR